MLYIHCPYCEEKRDEQEFRHAGEAYIARPENPEEVSDEEWGDYVFMRSNKKGWIWEQWEHVAGCRKVIVVNRNNVSNEIKATYDLTTGKLAFLQDKQASHAKETTLLNSKKKTEEAVA